MKSKNTIFLFVILGVILLGSCEEKMVSIPEFVLPDSQRNVLVEDLTGVKCPNCPAGASRLENISAQFSGRVKIVGIHGIQQASPIEGESKYDFRNEYSMNLEESFKPFLGKPSAVINRTFFEGEEYLGVTFFDIWQTYIENELTKEHLVDIALEVSYDEENKVVDLNVGVVPLKNLSGEFKLSVMVIESGIVDIQETQGDVIHDYVHNHVLMDMMTRFDGDEMGDNLINGQIVKRSFQYTLPTVEGLFQKDRIGIVVFLSDTSNGLKTVIQTVDTHI